jgi:hypothetical protein
MGIGSGRLTIFAVQQRPFIVTFLSMGWGQGRCRG